MAKRLLGLIATANRRKDLLRPERLVRMGGKWNGLHFDNPSIDLPAALTWTFEFSFEQPEDGEPVVLTVDWVPLPQGAAWSAMAGHTATGTTFGEPIECSAYFFEHYRYDAVELQILEQVATRLRLAVKVDGDIDGLGVPSWEVDEWLDFEGLYVQLNDVNSAVEAEERLAQFTDSSGLTATDSGHNFKFVA